MPQPISEIDVLWITAGLGCDGDGIAITAAISIRHSPTFGAGS